METLIALLSLCAGNSPITGEFPSQRPVTRSFDVFFDLGLNKRLHKQWRGWWFETPSCPLWRHCNVQHQDFWILTEKLGSSWCQSCRHWIKLFNAIAHFPGDYLGILRFTNHNFHVLHKKHVHKSVVRHLVGSYISLQLASLAIWLCQTAIMTCCHKSNWKYVLQIAR